MGENIVGYAEGTFDIFHYGHAIFLERVKQQCNYLIIGIFDDESERIYGKKILNCLQNRIKVLECIKQIDKIVIKKDSILTKDFIEKYKIDFVFHGDDYNQNEDEKYYKQAIDIGIYIKIPYTKNISSSIIKKHYDN